MPRYVKPNPRSNIAGAKRLENALVKQAKAFGVKFKEHAIRSMEETLNEIIDNSPIHTGASSGVTGAAFAYKINYPSHPAHSYASSVGNYFNQGQSGWQLHYKGVNQYRGSVYVTNPMWEPYLKFVEYGFYPASRSGFVASAWRNHLARSKSVT